jgi:hypothetical protein
MDIDGHEPLFFRGAQKTLAKWMPPVAMECAQRCLFYAGTDVRSFAKQLKDMGYMLCSERSRKPWPSEFDFLQECGNYTRDANVLALNAK